MTPSALIRGLIAPLALAAAAALAPGAAGAAPVSFNFSGVVTSVGSDGSGLFGSTFSAGQAVAGSWTFDTTATGTSLLSDVTAYAASFSVTIGGHSFGGNGQYRVFDNAGAGGDGFSVVEEGGGYSVPAALSPLVASTFFLQMLGMPDDTLANQDLVLNPDALWPLANPFYAPNGLRLDNPNDGTFGLLYFRVTDLHNAVPEPGTAALVAGALLACGAVRRRREAPQHAR